MDARQRAGVVALRGAVVAARRHDGVGVCDASALVGEGSLSVEQQAMVTTLTSNGAGVSVTADYGDATAGVTDRIASSRCFNRPPSSFARAQRSSSSITSMPVPACHRKWRRCAHSATLRI